LQWRSQNEAEEAMTSHEANLLKFLLAHYINFPLLERRQWLMTSLTGPSRKKLFAALLAIGPTSAKFCSPWSQPCGWDL